jgi:hypothetical protein
MLGTLLNMSGPVSLEELKDLVLRFLVVEQDCSVPEVGDALIEAYSKALEAEDEDENETYLAGDKLRAVLFKAFAAGYKPRVVRELKRRKIDFAHVNDEWVRDREAFWIENFNEHKVLMPRSLAAQVGQALGELEAAKSVALWQYHDEMEAQRAVG